MSNWLDLLPSHERQKIRERRKLSPEEYEKLREKVKNLEQIAEEMDRNERMAELSFALESEPQLKEALKRQVQEDLREQGMDSAVDGGLSDALRTAVEQGHFDLRIDADPETHVDQLILVPEGNVGEVLVVSPGLSDAYVAQFAQAMVGDEQ